MPSYPNRCQHLKTNGTLCGSPALRRNRFCYFHKRYQDERIRLNVDRRRRGTATFFLPVLEDANSIQMSLMQIMRLLLTGQIEHKTASLLMRCKPLAPTCVRPTSNRGFTKSSSTRATPTRASWIKLTSGTTKTSKKKWRKKRSTRSNKRSDRKRKRPPRKPASLPVGKPRKTSKPASAAANATRRKRS